MSAMLIDNINADLNETRIECMFGEPTTTIINVIGNGTKLNLRMHALKC
jgi:ABC-type Zn2+ transport system substrate-binding protein/surface adhesin